jgi:hypothetical protein
MPETTGTIHIKDGQVVRLENLSQWNRAIVSDDLSVILRKLAAAGWRLSGDYALTLTKTETKRNPEGPRNSCGPLVVILEKTAEALAALD